MSNLAETLQCRVREVVDRPDGKQNWRCLDANGREVWINGVDIAHPAVLLGTGESPLPGGPLEVTYRYEYGEQP